MLFVSRPRAIILAVDIRGFILAVRIPAPYRVERSHWAVFQPCRLISILRDYSSSQDPRHARISGPVLVLVDLQAGVPPDWTAVAQYRAPGYDIISLFAPVEDSIDAE